MPLPWRAGKRPHPLLKESPDEVPVAHRPRARHGVLPALLALALLGGCGREPASYTEDAPQISAGQIQFPAGSRQLDVLRSGR